MDTEGLDKKGVPLVEGTDHRVKARVQEIDTPSPTVEEQTTEGAISVAKSNVDISEEILNLVVALRFYQAGLQMLQTKIELLETIMDMADQP